MTEVLWPLEAYAEVLAQNRDVRILFTAGESTWHHVPRWTGDADAVDRRLLDLVVPPALDLGCGPGRLTTALAARGVPALGVDLCAAALAVAARRGAPALHRDLFARLPAEGRWRTVLLADGNIGIGGAPARLLARVHGLLAAGGLLLAEVRPDDVDRRGDARLVGPGDRMSPPFAWAEVGAPALLAAAPARAWTPVRIWDDADRRFVALVRR